MYTKEEASAVRTKFWTALGKYLKPIPNANADNINWINYKTGIKEIRLKTEVLNGFAFLAIEISGDEALRDTVLATFRRLDFKWESESIVIKNEWNDADKQVHQIVTHLEDVSIFRESDWPGIISFIKLNLLAFDLFWCENKEFFELSILK